MNLVPKQSRGQLTDRIKSKSKQLLGYVISVRELRLMLYIQYVMLNNQKLQGDKINIEEQEVLAKWFSDGHIIDGVTEKGRPKMSDGVKLKITNKFWGIICELLYLGYVDLNY